VQALAELEKTIAQGNGVAGGREMLFFQTVKGEKK
jgi:hypothetical protein